MTPQRNAQLDRRATSAQPTFTVEFRELDRRWIVRRDGVSRISSVHVSRSDAEHKARVTAQRLGYDVVVLSADGSVERRYGSEALHNRSRVFREPRRTV